MSRAIRRAQKIRMRLGGSANLSAPFPSKPKGMHWRTYERLRRNEEAAQQRSLAGMVALLNRLERPAVYIG